MRRGGRKAKKRTAMRTPARADEIKLPALGDWRTTDEDEINRRRLRAIEEKPQIRNLTPQHPIFSNFEVRSRSGMTYYVEIRDIERRHFHSTTIDFQINGLGTCKHVEAVLLHLQARFPRKFAAARRQGSERIDIVPDVAAGTLRVERNRSRLSPVFRRLFDREGRLRNVTPEDALERLARSRSKALRISQEVEPWLLSRQREEERPRLRREYEQKVRSGEFPRDETRLPLYPYQREGMLHLAFTERALLADEMGLGKTVQAIAACALLQRLGKARHALIVSPASLKTEWEEQIQKFTDLDYQVIFGPRSKRLRAYVEAPFFTIVNYEQMLRDALDVNTRLAPEIVILDEAQRIKNWNTKTAQAIKRLESRYAFVLTGTPIENRIDEIHSIMSFIDPAVLGPLFRFNREFYVLDERGRPKGYKNLDRLHERIRPRMLRRRKADVEDELPSRSDRNLFVPMSRSQLSSYRDHEAIVARLLQIAKRRALTKREQDKLMRELGMMRMLCDTPYILDPEDRSCPKLKELESLIDGLCADPEVKIVVFSEWVRMLELVGGLLEEMGLSYALHTGAVPQQRRRAEIRAFKTDPACRVLLSSDSGGVGLNLQQASVVINCDLPWNPAKLEQRIARVWRKHQMRNVTVINLVSENTIEHRMLGTLAVKRSLADGVLDRIGDLDQIPLSRGRQAFLERLEQVVTPVRAGASRRREAGARLPVDRAAGFAQRAAALLGRRLAGCEERYPEGKEHSVLLVVVDRDAAAVAARLEPLHREFFPPEETDAVAPVKLQVIEASAYEALQRLEQAGLIRDTSRVIRPLEPSPAPTRDALTAEERKQIAELRSKAGRKIRVARLLSAEELEEEAREALLAALPLLGRALAIERHLPPPEGIHDALGGPWQQLWGGALGGLRAFVGEERAGVSTVLAALDGEGCI